MDNHTEETEDRKIGEQYRRLANVAGLIRADVSQAPMTYTSDAGELAWETAVKIEEFYARQQPQATPDLDRVMAELRTRDRITAVLATLETAVADGRTEAEELAEEQRTGRHEGSLAYTQGRAAAYTRVLQAIAEARRQVANPTGRTRAENAQAFAEAVINTITPAGDTK